MVLNDQDWATCAEFWQRIRYQQRAVGLSPALTVRRLLASQSGQSVDRSALDLGR
jgi:hypothetical protein